MTVHTQFSPRQRAALASICATFFPADNGVPSASELGLRPNGPDLGRARPCGVRRLGLSDGLRREPDDLDRGDRTHERARARSAAGLGPVCPANDGGRSWGRRPVRSRIVLLPARHRNSRHGRAAARTFHLVIVAVAAPDGPEGAAAAAADTPAESHTRHAPTTHIVGIRPRTNAPRRGAAREPLAGSRRR